jgi:hypothetical protein
MLLCSVSLRNGFLNPKKIRKSPTNIYPVSAGNRLRRNSIILRTTGKATRIHQVHIRYYQILSGSIRYLRKSWGFRKFIGVMGLRSKFHMCNGGMIINKPPPYSHEGKFNLRNLHRWGYLYFMGLRGFIWLHIIAICDMYIPMYIQGHIRFLKAYDYHGVMYRESFYLT